jgi:site-specific recombinase XerD
MASKGRQVTKLETGIPNCHIIEYANKTELMLRVTIGKGVSYKQIHRGLGTMDWAEAMKLFGPVYGEVMAEPNANSRNQSIHLNKLVDEFYEHQSQRLRRGEVAEGTLKNKERSLYKAFLPWCAAKKLFTVSQVEHNTFKDYPADRVDAGFSFSTVEIEVRNIKEFLMWCQKAKNHWRGVHWLLIPLKEQKGGPKPNAAYLDPMIEEATDYLKAKQEDDSLSPHQRWLWKLFNQFWILQMDCGCRTAEFTYVQWKHVKIKGFNPARPDSLLDVVNDVHIPISKTGPRDIVFQSPALVILKRMYEEKGFTLNPEDYVFMNTLNRRRLGPQGFNKRFKTMHEDLFWAKNYTLYSTRSVYISDRIVQGTPISLIAQNCGNSVRIIESDYRDVILKLHVDPLVQRRFSEEEQGEYMPLV